MQHRLLTQPTANTALLCCGEVSKLGVEPLLYRDGTVQGIGQVRMSYHSFLELLQTARAESTTVVDVLCTSVNGRGRGVFASKM